MPRNTGGADAMEELGLGPGDTLIGKNPGLPLKSVENAAQLERNKGWALRVDPGGGKSFVLQQGTSIMKNWKSMVDGQRDRISKIKTKADREVRAERAKCKTLQQDQMRLQGAEARLRCWICSTLPQLEDEISRSRNWTTINLLRQRYCKPGRITHTPARVESLAYVWLATNFAHLFDQTLG